MNYYNEFEPYAAEWLRNLIKEGLIAPGIVDDRSITEVRASDLDGFTQCHFFAGIGGWSYALRLAGWPDDRPVWTGSCPCQPFSVAGKQAGFDDPRHLWPQFERLISERRPNQVFGEQVSGASDWLRLVRGDLEAMGYAVGAIPIEAASAGADHFRDRYWFVADANYSEWWTEKPGRNDARRPAPRRDESDGNASERGAGPVANGEGKPQREPNHDLRPLPWQDARISVGWTGQRHLQVGTREYFECSDGKWRALPPPRVRWLGNGIPARVSKLRAFGNAIDPRPAAEFIGAYLDTERAA